MLGFSAHLLLQFLVAVKLFVLISAVPAVFDCSFKHTYPNQYVAYFVDDNDINIDGKLDEKSWDEVPFTSSFVDISTITKPKFDTKAKMRWSKNYLYIAAVLEEPEIWANITSTCHCNTTDEDQVIFHDNDFEIFVDPNGDTHYYKEFEMNAYNATWDLVLNEPYANGGYENSSRVFGTNGFDMQPPLICSVNIDGGSINTPYSGNKRWSVEVALPIAGLSVNESEYSLPVDGTYWRINFSRVEWGVTIVQSSDSNNDLMYIKNASCQSCYVPGTPVEDNWVWSPMQEVSMHMPEKWGFLQFSTNDPEIPVDSVMSPEWPVRSVAMLLYNAEQEYYVEQGRYTDDLAVLNSYSALPILANGTCSSIPIILVGIDGHTFKASLIDEDGRYSASIDNTRLLLVSHA